MAKTFYTSMTIGDVGEEAFRAFMIGHDNVLNCVKVDHRRFDYDFAILLDDKTYKTAEIKSLAGGRRGRRYDTFVVEVWADNNQTRRPHWWADAESGALDYIVFISRYDKVAYYYNPRILVEHLSTAKALCRAADNNAHDSGWLAKVEWEAVEAGYMFSRDFSAHLDTLDY